MSTPTEPLQPTPPDLHPFGDLETLGFRLERATGRWWHWTESPGIELIDGKWFPCDCFWGGGIQYASEGYASPVEAAKQAKEYFT